MSEASTDPGAGGQSASGMSEEQARAYMEQLRSAPVEQVVAELMSSLLNAAQVKLGRNDARLLIDLAGLMSDHTRAHLSDELTGQIDQALGQLRLGQVEAESTPGRQAEESDLSASPRQPEQASGEYPEASGQQGSNATATPGPPGGDQRSRPSGAASKLWIPGRDF